MVEEGLEGEVVGREKHLFSLYQKMVEKGHSFSEVMDITAFRIIVDSVDMCYRVLGCVHNMYKPVPMRFRITSHPEGERLPITAHGVVRPVRRAH